MKHFLLSVFISVTASCIAIAANPQSPVSNSLFNDCSLANPDINVAQASVPSRDTRSMAFGYCMEPKSAFGYNSVLKGSYIMAICLDEDITTKFAGCKITDIMITTGYECRGMSIQTFITTDPSKPANIKTTKYKAQSFEYNTYTLSKPFEIEAGVPVYLGMMAVNAPDTYAYPVCADYIYSENPNSGLTAIKDDEGNWTWSRIPFEKGNLCIKCVIEGDNLPVNLGSLDIDVPPFIVPGKSLDLGINITNYAANTIDEFVIDVNIGDQPTQTITVSDAEVAQYMETKNFVVPAENTTSALNIPVSVKLVSVNGVDQDNNGYTLSDNGIFSSFSGGYTRNIVVEEGTGTWCGWCPRGIVGMEKMVTKYPDGTYIPIAVHRGDIMQVETYPPLVGGFPGAVVNRDPAIGEIDPEYPNLEAAYEAIVNGRKSFANLDLTVFTTDTEKELRFVSNTTFNIDAAGEEFALAYVVTENNVGPYDQNNYYAGTKLECEGWEKKAAKVEIYFNDVARGICDMYGLDNSVPADVKADQSFSHEYTAKFGNINDINNCRFVVMLINRITGVIENATMVKGLDGASVDKVEENASSISVQNGRITLNGEGSAAIYTIDGRKVSTIGANSSATLPAGLYIVTTPAGATKLMVK